MMIIRRMEKLPEDIYQLATEAREQGFRFLDRLIDDFQSGNNRFDLPGEALFAVFESGKCIGVGGVNVDPLGQSTCTGRVRRVFVSSAVRGQGVGKLLMLEIENWAKVRFTQLQLFTDTPGASAFYGSLGYQKVEETRISHIKRLA